MTYRNANSRRARSYRRSGQAWTPGRLAPRAWYDAELGQPKNVGYVQLDGTSGDYIFTPDSAATSFSNDIEVVMRVKVTDWSAAANQTLCGKYLATGNQRSWRFYATTAGAIGLSVSADGTSSVTTVTVTPTDALPDNTWVWLRMRLDLTNGSNSVGTLETAADTGYNIEPSSWTANGTANGTTISGIFDSTAATEIGAFSSGATERLAGQVGRCIVRSGFGGTTVADFNASDCYGDGYWHSSGYRWTLGLPKIYDRSSNNRAPATFGSGSNQPQWLPWTGVANVYFPGATGNSVSCLDAAPLDITGDIDVLVRAPVQDLAPAASRVFVAKGNSSASQYSWNLEQYQNNVYFIWTTGGTSATQQFVNVNVTGTLTPGRTYWLRGTLVAATGVATLYWAPDSDTVPTSWTQLATKTVGSTSIFSGSAPVSIGALGGGGSPATGAYQRAIVRDGIGGTTVADFNAELCGQSGYTDTLGNVWTVNRSTSGRKTVVQSPAARSARSLILHGTDDWIDVPAAAVPALDTFAAASSVTASFRRWHNPGTAGHAIFTTKNTVPNTTLGSTLRLNATATATQITSAAGDGTNSDAIDFPDVVSLGLRAVATHAIGNASPFINCQMNAGGSTTDTARNTTGTTSTGGAGRIGAYLGGAGAIDMEFETLICRNAATTDAEHGLLVAYYGGGL